MKNKLYVGLTVVLAAVSPHMTAQTNSFPTKEYIDVNKIRTTALLHGDLWNDPIGPDAACEFPKGSQKNVMFSSALWITGYDEQTQLHVSAQTYRQSGNDYWPGPLNNIGNTTLPTINNWAKIWKINKSDIDQFFTLSSRTTTNIPRAILEWPAKGNPYAAGNGGAALTISSDMAPYIDVNNDGKYNPVDGDYPEMLGDQMLWWVFNDNGIAHDHTVASMPLKMEIHAKAYALKRNTLADNIVFYEYELFNKSSNNYAGFRAGIWADAELGYYMDDYIGFDSSHRMGIVYNGDTLDGNGEISSYGLSMPMAGITLLGMPGELPGSPEPAGGFIYYNNENSPIGNPTTAANFDNYLRGRTLLGNSFTNDFQGPGIPSVGYGSGPDTRYVYPGDPADNTQWSECASGNPVGDRRFLINSDDINFAPGTSQKLAFALVTTDTIYGNACGKAGFAKIKEVADTAWKIYNTIKPVVSVKQIARANTLKLYPNPAIDRVVIEMPEANRADASIRLYDNMGRSIDIAPKYSGNNCEVDIAHLPNGLYHIQYTDGKNEYKGRFIKE